MSCKNVSTHSTKILLVTFSLFYASTGPDLQTVALCYRPVHSFVLLFYVFCLLPNLLTWCFENKNKQAVRLGRRHNMPPPHLDHWPFDLEVGVGVACDLGYPCAKFRPPRPFGFRVRADVRDIRQTDGRTDGRTTDADDRLMPRLPYGGGGIINWFWCQLVQVVHGEGAWNDWKWEFKVAWRWRQI